MAYTKMQKKEQKELAAGAAGGSVPVAMFDEFMKRMERHMFLVFSTQNYRREFMDSPCSG